MRLNRVMETCLYASDLEAAEAFYTRVLGLTAFARVAGRHVFFRCGDAVLLIFNPETTRGETEVPHGAAGSGHVAFAVAPADLAAWREHFARQHVDVELEKSWPSGGQSIYFRDPAGNCLELVTPALWGLPG